jgi:pimeloyl-ACP methyl ester carboxylesterase
MKNIITAKYLLDQKKKRLEEQQKRAAAEQQNLQKQKEEQDNERREKIREGLRLSYIAYHKHRVAEHYLTDHGFSDFMPLSSRIGTQGFCCIRDGKACLVFRGTETSSLLDITIDLLCLPWYRPATHFGFGFSWRSVRKDVRNWVKDHEGKFDRVALYGHSLGGAIAHIAALELASDKERTYDIAEVITYGAPRSSFLFTGETFDELLLKTKPKKTLGSVTFRVVNKLDLISKVPFSWSGYRHVGKLVYLSTDGEVYYDENASHKQMDEGFLEPVFRFFEQENTALLSPLSLSLTREKKYIPSSASGLQSNSQTLGMLLKQKYHQADRNMPLILLPFQIIFILIAPFILLASTYSYLMRSGSSHLKDQYAKYFFKTTTHIEDDLVIIKRKLGIKGPSRIMTAIGQFFKAITIIALYAGLFYVCYWIFTRWTWPIALELIYG